MELKIFLYKRLRLLLTFLMAGMLANALGCGDNTDVVVIDFSKAVAVGQSKGNSADRPRIRVAVGAMISPKETFIYYRQLLDYISKNLGLEAQLIQRKTYDEINELFGKGEIDLAFVCSGPYANGKEKYGFELLSTPQVHGSHFYQSYLIVNRDSPYHSLENLKGMVFAFTDPDSNTGKLVPTYWLGRMGERPETFFKKTLYTYSHDNSILAVDRGLVDGAAVDGLIWEYYHHKNPLVTSRTRVIRKSDHFGIPPLVTARHLSPELKERIHEIVLSMHLDPKGREILKELMIDRFIVPREEWYEGIRQMAHDLAMIEKETNAHSNP